jgi:trehalose 6-phosphate phosphatase
MTLNAGNAPQTLSSPPTDVRAMALFLDMDGVLASFAPTPDLVMPDPRRTAVLRRLGPVLGGRLAIISGRTLSEIDRITEAASPAASGVHGLEIRSRRGEVRTRPPAPAIRDAVAAFRTFAEANPGVIVEDKGVAAGLHYRQAPHAAAAAGQLARDLAAETGLTLQPGHMIFELKTPGTDKGTALIALMAEPPFAGAVPVMLGDDLTDEHAFRAAGTLGGFGVLVGPMRETAARYRLEGVPQVLDWLEAVADLGTVSAGEEIEA